MPPQLPKVVLPKVEVLTKSPIDGLKEIRTSFSNTLASVEAALPAGGPTLPGGQGGLKLPRIEQIFKGPTAAAEEIKSTFEATLGGLPPVGGGSPEPKRGTAGAEEILPTRERHRGTL